MGDVRVQIRRGRRTDFTAVMELLAHGGLPLPPADRATLRRFRLLVADLGTDFYVATVDGTLVGLVHVTYARQLTQGPAAALDRLVVAAPFRGKGIGTALLDFAQRRAATAAVQPSPACCRQQSATGVDSSSAAGSKRKGSGSSGTGLLRPIPCLRPPRASGAARDAAGIHPGTGA